MTAYNQIAANKRRTYLLMGAFMLLFVGFFYILGVVVESPLGFLIGGILFTSVTTAVSYFFSDRIVLKTVGARPATKEEFFDYYTVTENLCIASGLPRPDLYVIDDPAPNAFATGRNPDHAVVCATTGLLNKLDRGEIEGVVAHELSHVKNYDILVASIAAVLAGTLALVAQWIFRVRWSGQRGKSGGNAIALVLFVVALIVAPLAARIIQYAISRKREFLADADGVLLTRNPEGLASALEKISADPTRLEHATVSTAHLFISNPLKRKELGTGLSRLLSTHPPVEERIKALRAM